jgi:hypothetical protein
MSFYQCSKCKKTWQYPIGKCPECFLQLKENRGKNVKVIGVSNVNIPTILHPKVPYFVLVLEDEKGNHWAYKSLKEYKIGEAFEELRPKGREMESNFKKGAVALWRVKYDILEAIEKIIDLLGGIKINKNSKVLVLPTLLTPKHPHFAENTSPEFLEAIIKYLIQKGLDPKDIKVASQSFNDFSLEASAQKSQLLQVCLKNKITPLDLAKTDFVRKEKNGITFEITEEAFSNDLIINLPIMKLDSNLGVKGAAENILKLIKKETYLSQNHDELLVKAQEVLPGYFTLAEAVSIQKSTKYVIFLGLTLGSFSSLNLDRVFAQITMKEDLPKYLKDIKIENIPIIGREIEELQYDVEKF